MFISRNLAKNSAFKTILSKAGHFVHGESLIDFSPIAFDAKSIESADWLFFSSRKAVTFFFREEIILPEKIKIAALSAGTAATLKSIGKIVDFEGEINQTPIEIALDFEALAKQQKVMFPCAKNSLRSIQKTLSSAVETTDLVVYNNQAKIAIELSEFDILVFTSPMNALAFYAKNEIKFEQKVIAIGETTAQKLADLGIQNVNIAWQSTEIALADCCH